MSRPVYGGLTPFAWAGRLLLGAALTWCVGLAIAAPELPRLTAAAAAVVAAVTHWRPGIGLILVLALAPAGAVLAPAPARAAELFAWAFLAAWLLRLWRPLSDASWPRTITVPVALYAAAASTSWLTQTIGAAAGVPPAVVPSFVLQGLPQDYLILSSPEPETWTLLQTLTGLGVLLAALGITRTDRGLLRPMAWALVVSAAVLAIATVVDVARQWAQADFGAWFLLRYVNGERFSLHLRDLNAVGSLYVLAGLTAVALAMFDRIRRRTWIGLILLMTPALLLAGSRSSYFAAAAGVLILSVSHRRWPLTRPRLMAAGALAGVVLVVAVLTADWRTDVRGAAGRAVSLRSQFSETTARMFASSPVFGVGVGRYFTRSSEFMSDELRALYGNENAHNYFAQQFAELGVIGGLLFVWLVGAIVARGWSAARTLGGYDPALLGLSAGTAGYLLTCVTGHPLLVAEAALPFWITCGALVGVARDEGPVLLPHRIIAIAVGAMLAVEVGRGVASYRAVSATPAEHGFHGIETAEDGTPFRWVTRHGVTHIPDGVGFIRLRLRAPDEPMIRPLVVETAVAGRVIDRRTLPPNAWITYDIPIRETAGTAFRRVDLRVNQEWSEEVRLGRRAARRPIAVMVAEKIEWIPLS